MFDGKKIDYMPYDSDPHKVQPVYIEMRGWKNDLTGMRNLAQFPKELTDYIEYIEKQMEIPITIVSVGPDRTQTIVREKILA
jgi:adenylosuccinate synthase